MSKLTPPAMQNLKRREEFFKTHPEYKNSKLELARINRLKAYRKNKGKKKIVPQPKIVDGAKFYEGLKKQNSKSNFFKRILNVFNRKTK